MWKSTRTIVAALGVAMAMPSLSGFAHGVFDPGALPKGADQASAEVWLRRSDAWRRRGDLDAARSDLARAARIAPDRSDLAYHRARLQLAEGDAPGAIRSLEPFVDAFPDDAQAQALLARALVAVGRPADAVGAYARAIAASRQPAPDHYVARARARIAADAAQVEIAVRELDAGISRLGPVPALVHEAIALERAGGRHTTALARIEREIARAREPVWWQERRAEVLCEAGREQAARRSFGEALRAAQAAPDRRRRTPSWRSLESRLREGRTASCVAEVGP
jgi:tetratricopeptide (TPR) repeat protein